MNTSRKHARRAILMVGIALLISSTAQTAHESEKFVPADQVLEWNQLFIDTLIATNTANSSSQRLGAIVHTAIFDAYNGIEQRYTPIFVNSTAPHGASRRAAVIAAAYTALVGMFPSLSSLQREALDARYAASLAALSDDGGDGGESRERGIAWGREVAQTVLSWRATDGFSPPPASPFTGGLAVGQWRPTGGSCVAMTAPGLAFTSPFVVASTTQFDPGPPRGLGSLTYADDFNSVKALGRNTSSQRSDEQTRLAPFWEGNASVHWNQAANQIARARQLSISASNRLLAVLNIAMADTAFTIWSAKRHYGQVSTEVTWRPTTAIPLAETDGNSDTAADAGWLPLVTTPCHPEYPAGHPSLNGAAATVLLAHFADSQTFTLTTTGRPNRTYTSISQARTDGNNARVWGGMHYPSTVAVSDAVGEAIANYVNLNAMVRSTAAVKGRAYRRFRLFRTGVLVSDSVTAARFGEWSAPVSLGSLVNSPFDDISPHVSKAGLSLYFASTRTAGSFGGEDIWISKRATDGDPWGVPVNVGPMINASSNERAPALSRDGHFLFFNSDRSGGFGGSDIWVSWRSHIHDDFGWQEPVNLGAAINTAAFEGGAAFLESDGAGRPQLYFVSNRPGGAGMQDMYVSTMSGGWFGPSVRVAELSSQHSDLSPAIRHDGLEILIGSNRPGTLGLNDLWVATRRTIFDVWSDPVHLGFVINSASNETFPSLSSGGRTLLFNSNRSDSVGGLDLYMVSR